MTSAADRVTQAEQLRLLGEAICALTDPQREVILLRYYEGLRPREIARRLAIPVNTVRSRTRRAIEGLRSELDVQQDGDRRRWLATLLPIARAPGRASRAAPIVAGALGLTAVCAAVLMSLQPIQHEAIDPDGPTPTGRPPDRAAAAPALRGSQRDEPLAAGDVPLSPAPADPSPALPAPASPKVLAAFGIVRGHDGQPLAGARVTLRPHREEPGSTAHASSDATGHFVLRMPRSTSLRRGWLVAEARGHAAERRAFVFGARVDVRLDRGATVEVLVVDGQGRPLPNAEVSFYRVLWKLATRTGPRGRAVFEHVPLGPIRLVAASRAHIGRSARVVVAPGARGEVRVVAEPRALLMGSVVRDSDGRPVGGATVALHRDPGSAAWTEVTTADDGSFALPLHFPGEGMVRASAPGLGEAWPHFRTPEGQMAGVPSAESDAPLVLRLGMGGGSETRRVHVVDSEGRPAATNKGDLEVLPLFGAEVAPSSDPSTFQLTIAGGASSVLVGARHRDGRIGGQSFPLGETEEPLVLHLARAGRLGGLVLDPDGEPAPGAVVTLAVPGPPALGAQRPEAQIRNAMRLFPDRIGVKRVTDGEGRFDFGVWTIGTYRLDAVAGRQGQARVENVTVRVGERSTVNVRLRRGATIAGRVTGLPEQATRWALRPRAWHPGKVRQGSPWEGRVFSDGSFEIHGITAESCDVTLWVPSPDGHRFKALLEGVAAGSGDLILRLEQEVTPPTRFGPPR